MFENVDVCYLNFLVMLEYIVFDGWVVGNVMYLEYDMMIMNNLYIGSDFDVFFEVDGNFEVVIVIVIKCVIVW